MIKLLVICLASFLLWIMFAGLIILWLADGRIKREQALHAFVSSLIAFVVVEMIKTLYPTLRPFQANGGAAFVAWNPVDGSFPSWHAAAAFAIAVTIWLHNRKLGLVFLAGAILLGVARVLANVHYPLDILGGAVLGTIIAYAVEKVHLRA